jgi:very-short-patch-repair endonuclease
MPGADGGFDRIGRNDHPREVDISRLADRQEGLISMEQLKELGFSYRQIARRVDLGRLHPRFPGVFSVGRQRLAPLGHLLAAQLSAGPTSFLSHRTAAAVHGLRSINVRDIEVTIPGTGGRHRDGFTVHRCREEPHPDDLRTRGLLKLSSVLRLLVELCPRETPAELERLITQAVQKNLLRPDRADGRAVIDQALERYAGYPGTRRLNNALAVYRRTESHASQLELAFDRFLARHPELPDPQRNLHIGGWEIDRFWPEHNLVVELDGRPYHVSARDMERDRAKDIDLQKRGLTPLRFTDFRFEHDRAAILADLRHFLVHAQR